MNLTFKKEWTHNFGNNDSKLEEKPEEIEKIKNIVKDLEAKQWYLLDAYDSTNVYSNQKKNMKNKKIPHDASELERCQLYGQIYSLEKQFTILRKSFTCSHWSYFFIILIFACLVANDLLLKEEVSVKASIGAVTIVVLIGLITAYVYFATKLSVQVQAEKKVFINKNKFKYLGNFKT